MINIIHTNHLKYISLYIKNNETNKKYIIYKQISPSYYYNIDNTKQIKIKKAIYNNINDIDTTIIKKEIKGGFYNNLSLTKHNVINKQNMLNLKNSKYIIHNSKMDYQQIRLELYKTIGVLVKCSKCLMMMIFINYF